MTKPGNRRALLSAVEGFLEALVAGDSSLAPIAADSRCTFNGVVGPLGSSSVWGRVRRIPARQTFVDPDTQSAVFFGVLSNSSSQHASLVKHDWFYAVRIRLDGAVIVDVEEISFEGTWAHYPTDPSSVEMDPRFDAPVPIDEQTSREEMEVAIAAYCAAVERTGPASGVPFHPDARRTELGQPTTDSWNFPLTPRGDFTNDGWNWAVANIRVPVVDLARGVAVAIFALTLSPTSHPDFSPCLVVESFKFEDGLIKRMFAVYHAGTADDGWSDR